MKRMKKASFIAILTTLVVFGFGQFLAANTFSIGDCDTYLQNPTYPFLYECPDDFCNYTSTIYTCTQNGQEIPIYYRNPDCDNYYCVYQ